ncbi:hypothetical protein PMIN06_011336 [Paraphaeosphaeria minitans]
MDPNGPQKLSSSASDKHTPPSPIKISSPDHESPSPSTTQATPIKASTPSTPPTPRHRRSKVHVDPVAALDAWNSSPKSREFAKPIKENSSDLDFPKQLQLASSYKVTTTQTHIQAGPEHGVDVVDWAADVTTEGRVRNENISNATWGLGDWLQFLGP